MKNFVRFKECLRVGAYLSLDPDIEPPSPLHDCCSYCATMCKCGGMSCEVSVMPFEFTDYKLQTRQRSMMEILSRLHQ